ncbi:MAG: hypothetical protein IKP40_09455 [Clostridia bacterium]|nr:hypothetical protein [Clostridia bacterium]
MSNTLLVTRLLLRQMIAGMNPFTGSYADSKKRSRAIFRTIGIVVLLLMGIASVVYIEYLLFTLLEKVRQPLLLPGLAVLVGMLSTLLLGLFQGLGSLYQSRDSVFLAVLPVTSHQIFFARIISLYVSELALNVPLMGPALVLYIISRGTAWPYALTGLIVFLLTPAIPLAIVVAVSSLLMRVSGFAKHRETVTMALSMVLAFGYSLAVSRFNGSMGQEEGMEMLVSLLTGSNGLLNRMLQIFPPARWGVDGFAGSVPYLLLFAGVSVAALALAWAAFGGGYLPLALSIGEVSTGTSRKIGRSDWRSVSSFWALHRLEWRMLMRTPVWMMNSLFGLVIFPVMMIIGFGSGFSRAEVNMGNIMEFLLSEVPAVYVVMGAAAMASMITMINPACSTAVSREGGNWPFALTLPVTQRTRMMAKLAMGEEINLAGSLLMCIPLVIFGTPLWIIAIAFVVANMVGLAANAGSLALDLLHPNLKWTNETQAIKANFHTMLGMALWALLLGLSVVLMVLLQDNPDLSAWAVGALLVIACALCCGFLLHVARKDAVMDD